ncbi:Putative Zn-dependent protease, contains TPR repeats [Delftia tsuruhatensis]|nr:Putative Zn-dependent protease, contains TPR repeats [Delftia tsuruhatensis]CAC9680948.1 Putative Zn-dependent protease, contains TPR repeats [Delftia tsuruhatensis]
MLRCSNVRIQGLFVWAAGVNCWYKEVRPDVDGWREMNEMTQRLEALLASGKDSAMLRCTLGKTYLEADSPEVARAHLAKATALDPGYSVAWKLLGKACLQMGDQAAAREAWTAGLDCAQGKGDAQVVKELGVFLRRLERSDG